MPKLPKAIYEQLTDEGKRIHIAQLNKETKKRSTRKVRSNMANDIAKKVIAGMKRKTRTTKRKRTYRKR